MSTESEIDVFDLPSGHRGSDNVLFRNAATAESLGGENTNNQDLKKLRASAIYEASCILEKAGLRAVQLHINHSGQVQTCDLEHNSVDEELLSSISCAFPPCSDYFLDATRTHHA